MTWQEIKDRWNCWWGEQCALAHARDKCVDLAKQVEHLAHDYECLASALSEQLHVQSQTLDALEAAETYIALMEKAWLLKVDGSQ